jgi:DNA modification methylase
MLLQANAFQIPLPDKAVNCVVTSPPYYSLRKYAGEQEFDYSDGWRGAYGLEPTLQMYIDHTVEWCREVWRVLRDDGVFFLNLGDSYMGSGGAHKAHHANPGLSKSSERDGVPHESSGGSSGRALANYPGRGCLCENLCGACRVAYRIGKSHKHDQRYPMRFLSPSGTSHGSRESVTDPLPIARSVPQADRSAIAIQDQEHSLNPSGEQPLSSQESKPSESSQQPQEDSRLSDNFSFCLLCARSLAPDGQPSAYMLGESLKTDDYNRGTASVVSGQASRSQNKDMACEYCVEAYPDYTTASRLKPKDLMGVPWRVALALQADGWYLRSDIIWAKPNPMPESVTDRPTKSHEYMFLLTKNKKYFYDADSIREPVKTESKMRAMRGNSDENKYAAGEHMPPGVHANTMSQPRNHRGYDDMDGAIDRGETPLNPAGRNKRTVWTISTRPYSGAHFATFPPELVEPCIKAGCPEDGTVLDPFSGSGTTLMVARKLGRKGVGLDVSFEYIQLAKERLGLKALEQWEAGKPGETDLEGLPMFMPPTSEVANG